MMHNKPIRMIHMSSTPVVGAMGKLSYLLSQFGEYESISVIYKDYGVDSGLSGFFLNHSVLYDKNIKDFLLEYIKTVDIVQIHNLIPDEFLDILSYCKKKCIFIYHCHSVMKEPPIFYDMSNNFNIKFDKKLVVAQFQPRFYQDYTIVPNIVLYKPCLKKKKNNELLNIIYSPSNPKPLSVYGNKYSKKMYEILEFLNKNNKIKFMNLSKCSPNHLFLLRSLKAHITIDEIVSGGYHQVSLEGLCAGNVVINNADYFAQSMLKQIAGIDECPFYICNEDNFYDRIQELIINDDLVRKYQQLSYDFFINYLSPKKIFNYYDNIYKQLI